MRALLLTGLAPIAIASHAWAAATLTITPDQALYQVGDTITLNVFGEVIGDEETPYPMDNVIYGRIRFAADLADYVASHQEPLMLPFFGPWVLIPLSGGDGFGEAFHQWSGTSNPEETAVPLSASVTLLAAAPGVLDYSWQTDGDLDLRFDFFDLREAPGGSVVIVPELSTGALLALGVLGTAIGRKWVRRG